MLYPIELRAQPGDTRNMHETRLFQRLSLHDPLKREFYHEQPIIDLAPTQHPPAFPALVTPRSSGSLSSNASRP